MPELPEVERARALIAERGLRRRIAAVDDTDALRLPSPRPRRDRRPRWSAASSSRPTGIGKTMWFETDDDGPELGLHLGMAGRIYVDDASDGDPANYDNPNPVWDRFTIFFEDGGKLILRDKRRLGRAVLEPDLSALGPDAAEITRDRVPRARRPRDAGRSRRG